MVYSIWGRAEVHVTSASPSDGNSVNPRHFRFRVFRPCHFRLRHFRFRVRRNSGQLSEVLAMMSRALGGPRDDVTHPTLPNLNCVPRQTFFYTAVFPYNSLNSRRLSEVRAMTSLTGQIQNLTCGQRYKMIAGQLKVHCDPTIISCPNSEINT